MSGYYSNDTAKIGALLERIADSLELIERHLAPQHQLMESTAEFPIVNPVQCQVCQDTRVDPDFDAYKRKCRACAVPEHRLKDYVYEKAHAESCKDPQELGYDGAFGRGPNEPPANYKRLPKGERCPEAWSDAQGNSWCPHGTEQMQPGVDWHISMERDAWVSSRHRHTIRGGLRAGRMDVV
jgi:hypothetical protein